MLKNAARLALMKPGAYLVNCARGGLINEGDVAAALQRGQLTGYGADVVEQEPVVPTNPLLTAPNVLLTPHVGSRTYESVERQAIMAVENMLRVPHGQPPHAQGNTLEQQTSPQRRRVPFLSPSESWSSSRRVPLGSRISGEFLKPILEARKAG